MCLCMYVYVCGYVCGDWVAVDRGYRAWKEWSAVGELMVGWGGALRGRSEGGTRGWVD